MERITRTLTTSDGWCPWPALRARQGESQRDVLQITSSRASKGILNRGSSLGEGGETRDENGDERPGVPEAEREVDEHRVPEILSLVVARERVIGSGDDGSDKDREDEGDYEMAAPPDVQEDGVEDGEEAKPPAHSVDGVVARINELIKYVAKQEEVDDSPACQRKLGQLDRPSPFLHSAHSGAALL